VLLTATAQNLRRLQRWAHERHFAPQKNIVTFRASVKSVADLPIGGVISLRGMLLLATGYMRLGDGFMWQVVTHECWSSDSAFFETREAITRFLFLKDEPAPADLCFVLGSPTPSSMVPAVDLYRRGLTPKILISGHGPAPANEPECDLYKAYAMERGVPEQAILLERKASNTLENFVFSKAVIEQQIGWHTLKCVAIAAKPFHMRRALMTARRHWPAHLRYLMLPSNAPDDPPADTWWQTEHGRRFVFSELRAIAAYALEGHIGGF
jgi:hypothetical protein